MCPVGTWVGEDRAGEPPGGGQEVKPAAPASWVPLLAPGASFSLGWQGHRVLSTFKGLSWIFTREMATSLLALNEEDEYSRRIWTMFFVSKGPKPLMVGRALQTKERKRNGTMIQKPSNTVLAKINSCQNLSV